MKVHQAIMMLSEPERKSVRIRLASQWFDNDPGLLEWWDGVIQLHLVGKPLKAADLWRTVRKKAATKKDIAYLHTRTSALVKCIEQYWQQTAFEADKFMQAQCLLRSLRTRAWGAEYARTYRDLVRQMDQEPLRGMEHHATLLHCEEEHLLAPLMKEELDYTRPLYQRSMDALDRAYVIKKLSLVCKAISQDQIFKISHTYHHIDHVLAWVNEYDPELEPIPHLYRSLYCMLTASPELELTTYLRAKSFFIGRWEAFKHRPAGELHDISTYLLNHCVVRMNRGESTYKAEVVALYQWLLEERVLESDGQVEAPLFRNAFLALSQAGDSHALERLFSGYSDRVGGETGKAMVRFCRGMHAYNLHNWENATEHLESALVHLCLHADDRLEAEIRGMLVRTAYDRGDLAASKERLSGMKRMLSSTTMKGEGKRQFEGFLQFTSDFLAVASLPPAPQMAACLKQLEDLKQPMESKEPASKFFGKRWLVSQLTRIVHNGH